VKLKVLKPDDDLVSNEALVIVGAPPSMSFVYKKTPVGREVTDVQDVEGYPLSVQEDYSTLVRAAREKLDTKFTTGYLIVHPKDRYKFEHIRRELSLGLEAVLPSGYVLSESFGEVDGMDVWRVKLKKIAGDAPVRWLDLIRKA